MSPPDDASHPGACVPQTTARDLLCGIVRSTAVAVWHYTLLAVLAAPNKACVRRTTAGARGTWLIPLGQLSGDAIISIAFLIITPQAPVVRAYCIRPPTTVLTYIPATHLTPAAMIDRRGFTRGAGRLRCGLAARPTSAEICPSRGAHQGATYCQPARSL